jgi:hypothetical protein
MIFPGRCKDISIGGVRIHSRNISRLSSGVEIITVIPYPNEKKSLKKKAIVKWTQYDQFGIQFFKRKNIRKYYQQDMYIFSDAMVIPASIINLSIGGAQIECNDMSQVNKESQIYATIPFAKRKGHVTRKAIVRWVQKDQIGIQFI